MATARRGAVRRHRPALGVLGADETGTCPYTLHRWFPGFRGPPSPRSADDVPSRAGHHWTTTLADSARPAGGPGRQRRPASVVVTLPPTAVTTIDPATPKQRLNEGSTKPDAERSNLRRRDDRTRRKTLPDVVWCVERWSARHTTPQPHSRGSVPPNPAGCIAPHRYIRPGNPPSSPRSTAPGSLPPSVRHPI